MNILLPNGNRLLLSVTLACAATGCAASSHSGDSAQPNATAATQATASSQQQSTGGTASAQPVRPSQEQFDSPEAAAASLKEAIRMRDRDALQRIFGPEGHDLIFSGDRVQENNEMAAFERHLGEQLRVDKPNDSRAVLYVGSANWPFPIPLVKADGGRWLFDTAAGKDEILNRRIGRNELDTIDVCQAYVRAQQEYAHLDRTGDKAFQYARRFRSTEGKHDGLYWEPTNAGDFSPMGSLVAQAEAEGYSKTPLHQHHDPYHGYYYHILTAQGPAAPGGKMSYLADDKLTKGFALIAFPAKWGDSGVMTFVVNQEGKIYQKDLGPQTDELARKIDVYDPDNTWKEVKQ